MNRPQLLQRHARRCARRLDPAIERLLEPAGDWWLWHWTEIAVSPALHATDDAVARIEGLLNASTERG